MTVVDYAQKRILIVSNGGICRGPMAAAVLSRLLRESGRGDAIQVAASAISDAHVGRPPDPLAIEVASARGYDIGDFRVRQIKSRDFYATATLATDVLILNSLRNIAPHGWGDHPRLLARYAGLGIANIVDPYGGTTGDYEMALNLIEASCKGVAAALP